MELANLDLPHSASLPSAVVAAGAKAAASSISESFASDWLLWGAVVLIGMVVVFSRWSGARAARRLNAAADAYASRELLRLIDGSRISPSARRVPPASPAPRFLENATCSS